MRECVLIVDIKKAARRPFLFARELDFTIFTLSVKNQCFTDNLHFFSFSFANNSVDD